MLKEGGDYGWPTCYFDPTQKKLVLSPEYGGDGGKKTNDCAKFEPPVAAFPAHWAPNDLKIYKGSQVPKGYQGGAFIAFHGSWNRARRTGYKVIRLRFANGRATGEYEDFLTAFVASDQAVWGRPVGIAVAHDGALLVSEDGNGAIWRITYRGGNR